MDKILFRGKASALSEWLKRESDLNKGWSVAKYIENLAREERRAKSVLVGNIQENTTRTATL